MPAVMPLRKSVAQPRSWAAFGALGVVFGDLALMSLIGANGFTPGFKILTGMGLLGAALIYGDGVITPAISVLSALEGVNVVTTAFKPFVMPMTVVILLGLFAAQRFGTEKIGSAFGPVMLLWFTVIAVLGSVSI